MGHDLFFAVERVGTAIKPYHLRGEFWDEFMDFDKPSMEGNGNEKLELGEVALQLAYVDVLNFIYIKYDSDKDVRVSRSEAKKIFKDLGLGYRRTDGTLWTLDDPQFDPIWQVCGELGFPVLMHTADPSAFFLPIDPANERWEELSRSSFDLYFSSFRL